MENKRILYDFCPRCSGLMKNGVCVSCGYEKKGAQENPPAVQTPVRKKNTGIIIGFCIGGFLFLVILCLAICLIATGRI